MRLSHFQEFGQFLFIKHGNITLLVMLGVLYLDTGLGHAFLNPTREVAIGVLELVAAAFMFMGAFLVYVRRIRAALAGYIIMAGCLLATVVMHVIVLIRQVRVG